MKQITIKYIILVAGFYPIKTEYFRNGFELKSHYINVNYIDQGIYEGPYYINPIHGCCGYSEKNGDSKYQTFEKTIVLNLDCTDKDIYNIEMINTILEEQKLFDIAFQLEKELILLINNDISFPIITIKAFDSDNKLLTILNNIKRINVPSLINNNTKLVAEKIQRQNNRLMNGFSHSSISFLEERNVRFKRALTLFYQSFYIPDEIVSFILLITVLETLLSKETYEKISSCVNCNQKVYKITDSVSKNVSILLYDKNDVIKKEIKKDYTIRSKYIHGVKNIEITQSELFILKEKVRKTLLMYWFTSINIKKTHHKDIIMYMLSNEYNSEIFKSFFISLNDNPYNESKSDILKIIVEGIRTGNIIIK